jgi:hypothetical protein
MAIDPETGTDIENESEVRPDTNPKFYNDDPDAVVIQNPDGSFVHGSLDDMQDIAAQIAALPPDEDDVIEAVEASPSMYLQMARELLSRN